MNKKIDELINKIQLIRGDKQDDDDYLYKKDIYVEETAVSIDDSTTHNNDKPVENNEDFELPDIEDEEVPDFLQGEEIEKF